MFNCRNESHCEANSRPCLVQGVQGRYGARMTCARDNWAAYYYGSNLRNGASIP